MMVRVHKEWSKICQTLKSLILKGKEKTENTSYLSDEKKNLFVNRYLFTEEYMYLAPPFFFMLKFCWWEVTKLDTQLQRGLVFF